MLSFPCTFALRGESGDIYFDGTGGIIKLEFTRRTFIFGHSFSVRQVNGFTYECDVNCGVKDMKHSKFVRDVF